jgi:exosortase A
MMDEPVNAARGRFRGRNLRLLGRLWWLQGAFWVLVATVVTLTWSTWAGLLDVWSNQFGYSHGFLVAPIAAWLSWRTLYLNPQRPLNPAAGMLVVVAAASFVWFFFRMASVRTLEQVAATALLWTAATAVLGWRWGRALLFPIGYLLFAIPIWQALVPVLQPMTSAAAGALCEALGIPTHLDGNVVHIPNGVFAIETGCAGSHYLVASITLAALYGYLEYRRPRSALILVGIAAAFAVVCNWLRVVIVIHAGYTAGMDHPWVDDHNMVGWVLFVVALIPLSLAARRLERDRLEDPAPHPDAASPRPPRGCSRATASALHRRSRRRRRCGAGSARWDQMSIGHQRSRRRTPGIGSPTRTTASESRCFRPPTWSRQMEEKSSTTTTGSRVTEAGA